MALCVAVADRVGVHARQPADPDRRRIWRHRGTGRTGDLDLGLLRRGDQPLRRRADPRRSTARSCWRRSSVLLIVSGDRRHVRAELSSADDRPRAARRRDRRLLVDVDRDRDAPPAAGRDVPKGLAMLNARQRHRRRRSSAPLGSYLGGIIGWRGAFFFVVPVARRSRSSGSGSPCRRCRRAGRPGRGNVFRLLAQPQVALGMTAILLLFMGQFALFTYLRPFLESRHRPLTCRALAGVPGGRPRRGRRDLVHQPAARQAPLCAAGRYSGGHGGDCRPADRVRPCRSIAVVGLLVLWGFFGTAAPGGWGTWLARVVPDEAEAGGGLQVAVIQFAIMIGAAAGGLIFDAVGWWSAFALGAPRPPARLVAGRVRRLEELGGAPIG